MPELDVRIRRTGPPERQLEALAERLLRHPALRRHVERGRHRLVALELPERAAKAARSRQPTTYLATIADYANGRTLLVEGNLARGDVTEVIETNVQSLPSSEEFEEAVQIVTEDRTLGPALEQRELRAYPPMPPLIESEQPDGSIERTVAVGLLPEHGRRRHEIVGVNMLRREVTRFEGGAPEGSAADNPICGLSGTYQPTTSKGTAGQVNVTVSQAGTVLWRFQVVRPAASSGTRGSGVELRFVDYRGKRVLYRAHVPILNVRYDGNACGPYRDWQWQEGMFQANGNDVGAGFRLCPAPAQTILDSGVDQGNFRGGAIWVEGQEVVIASELEAGWYRYVSEWRLHANGTIRPRFGFAAVQNSCVCTEHYHHAYWRFDFDIRTPDHNRVREFNNPALVGSSKWHTKSYEIRRYRDAARKRKWRIENTQSGEAYEVLPGHDDGVADAYARGDLWVLRYRGTELDDGNNWTSAYTEADLHKFVNGEAVSDHDVVVWYAAHFTHSPSDEESGHRVGPDLVPDNW